MKKNVLMITDLEGILGIEDNRVTEENLQRYAEGLNCYIDRLVAYKKEVYICDIHNGGGMLDVTYLKHEPHVVHGIENIDFSVDYEYAILVGFHGMSKENGILCHTFRIDIDNIRIYKEPCGEITLFAWWLMRHNIPIKFITGAAGIEREARRLKIPFFVTKKKTYEDARYDKLLAFLDMRLQSKLLYRVELKGTITMSTIYDNVLSYFDMKSYLMAGHELFFPGIDEFMEKLPDIFKRLDKAWKDHFAQSIEDVTQADISYMYEEKEAF